MSTSADFSSSNANEQQMLDPAWSSPTIVSTSTSRAGYPVILAGDQDLLHVFWEQESRVYHAMYLDHNWTSPRSIGTGQHPSAGLAADGTVHVVFSNEFAGVFNIFYVALRNGAWSLPRLVSKTTGASTLPSLAIDAAGKVHAVWADMTPGFSVIYHGWLEQTWLNEPLLNARGTAPVLIKDSVQRLLHLAYQGSGTGSGPREIFLLQGTTHSWSLPENISMSAINESSSAAMACDAAGTIHVVWREQQSNYSHIRYTFGRRGHWSSSERISDDGVDSRAPRVEVTQDNQVQVVWRQGTTIAYRRRSTPNGQWTSITNLVSNPRGLGNPALSGASDGHLYMAWGGWTTFSERAIYTSQRLPVVKPQVFLPNLLAE